MIATLVSHPPTSFVKYKAKPCFCANATLQEKDLKDGCFRKTKENAANKC